MLRLRGAGFHRLASFRCQRGVPVQVLGTVDPTPIPMGIHDSTNEVGVVDVRDAAIGDRGHVGGESGGRLGSCNGEKCRKFHVDEIESMAVRVRKQGNREYEEKRA